MTDLPIDRCSTTSTVRALSTWFGAHMTKRKRLNVGDGHPENDGVPGDFPEEEVDSNVCPITEPGEYMEARGRAMKGRKRER